MSSIMPLLKVAATTGESGGSAGTTNKYMDVHYQGKIGTLIINSEKVFFRSKAVTPPPSNKPVVARSWRWAAIDRVELLDPARGFSTDRMLKLKPKIHGEGNKAVTISVPGDIVDDLVKDMESRLSASSLGIEGTTNAVSKEPRKSVTSTAIAPATPHSLQEGISKLRRMSQKNAPNLKATMNKEQDNSKKVQPGAASNTEATTNTTQKRTTKQTTAKPRRPTLSEKVKPPPVQLDATTEPNTQPITPQAATTDKERLSLSKTVVNNFLSATMNSPITKKARPPNRLSLMKKEMEQSENKSEDESEMEWSRVPTKKVVPPKRPLLYFLKPPPPRRSISDEVDEELEALEQDPTTDKESNNNKAEGKPKKKSIKAFQKDKKDQKMVEQQENVVVTPPQQPKPKVTRNSWNQPDMVFTPPSHEKEKVACNKKATSGCQHLDHHDDRDIVFTPPTQNKGKVQNDIVFTPTLLEPKAACAAPVNSTTSKTSRTTTSDAACPAEASSPTTSSTPPQRNSIAACLFNPDAPENRFRVMVLKHAATCTCLEGDCAYDPTCSEYKDLLLHMESCKEDDECSVDKCRVTKNFLITMQLVAELQNKDGNGSKEGSGNVSADAKKKEFLVGVGAVAPIPVVDITRKDDDCDGGSVVSDDGTWWSNTDWRNSIHADFDELEIR